MSLIVTATFAIGTAVEMGVLIFLSKSVDTITLINEIMLTFLVGIVVGRSYGKEFFEKMQWHLKSKTMPAKDILNGAVMTIASMMLITPGIVTDIAGLLIITPLTRGIFIDMAANFTRKRTSSGELFYFFKG
ncbi:MAG: hypothetical protein COV66_13750 [Nitrospinae bacterium CG11_big_fil_rev_8_21_14_0_20_45_15]|nr:MAG: hypothetical protein COV66_13750 [Nitrospinae bacterium CG11_big_fil_rev_8_21_14_0_20_45_15]